MIPKFSIQCAADPQPIVIKNVYREVLTKRGVGKTIGVGIRFTRKRPRNRYVSILWRRP